MMFVPAERQLECLEYLLSFAESNPDIDFRMIRKDAAAASSHLPLPTLILTDSFCYLRIPRSDPSYDVSVLCDPKLRDLFCSYYDRVLEHSEAGIGKLQDSVQYLISTKPPFARDMPHCFTGSPWSWVWTAA